jgi:PadR family transcriptional regulator, regulatory protein PadR
MTPRTGLGELEQLVLLALARLGDGAYGAAVRREIRERTRRSVSPGTIYPTLDRLERKGCVRSWSGEPTSERGGRSRRHYALTPVGLAELRKAWSEMTALAEGLEGLLDAGR